jgi:oligopeptide transport system substrate-binding protein
MRKTTIVVAALTAGLVFLTWWGWKNLKFGSGGPTELRLALDDKVESLDPAKAYTDDSLLVSAQVLEPLFQYHYLKRPYEVEPLVAEGLPLFSEKGRVVRVRIRKNVFYHPSEAFGNTPRALKAQDFVVQMKRLALDPLKSPGRGLFSELLIGFAGYSEAVGHDWRRLPAVDLPGIRALDDHTLEIRLTKSEPNITYYLALNFTAPVPWELVEFFNNNLDYVMVGTGPYVYKSYNGLHFDLEKYAGYRDDFYPTSGDRYANVQKLLDSSKQRIPFIDKVRFYVTANERDRWEKFFDRGIDILTVPKTFLPKLRDARGEPTPELRENGVELKHFPTLANRWLAFNMRDSLLGKNENLRRAIAYGVDYEKYIQVLSQNTNLRANSILVPGIAGYQPAKEFRFRHDPVLAREYLRKAGFPDPAKVPEIVYSTRGNQGVNLLEARFIEAQLEALGLRVRTEVLTFSEFLRKGRAGELQFFTDNWLFDYPDGENILQLLVSSNFPGINKSAYANPKVDALYERLKVTTNADQRNQIVLEMEELVFDDLPWIPLMYESSFVLHYPEIKNFRKSSIIRNYVKYLKRED